MSEPEPVGPGERPSGRLTRVLGAPELSWLVDRVRGRIARGAPLDGTVTLPGATPRQRQAVARLLGRPPGRGSSLSVPLSAVEAALRSAGLANDLRDAVEALSGAVPDLAAERAGLTARRDAALQAARSGRYAGEQWHEAWLADLSADGTLTRLLRTERDGALAQAAAVLNFLPAAELPLPVLAERATGDTKALSVPPLPGLVLRALARWRGTQPPPNQAARRELWDAFGVIVDDLASQVLVLGLSAGGGPLGRWLTEAAALGVPFRVTLHQISSMPVILDAPVIYVCENPAVLRAAAAELGPGCAPLICTEGIPSAACHRLLATAADPSVRQAGGRAVLRWRGDFDWTGLRTTAAAIARHGATPWRMTASDYTAGLAGGDSEPLKGQPAGSSWDPGLAERMRSAGHAVMEERLIPELLSDLRGAATGRPASEPGEDGP
jgi:uncharacterized protein (TIGR02679 family)